MNEVHISGNLARDPVIRSTKTGKQVASFTVAVNEPYTTPFGEQKEKTSWVNVVAWNSWAEAVGNALKKGSRVVVDGKINTRSYDKPDGQRHYVTEVTANFISMPIGVSRTNADNNQAPYGNYSSGTSQNQQEFNQFGPSGPDPENQPPKEQGAMFPEGGPQSDEEIPF